LSRRPTAGNQDGATALLNAFASMVIYSSVALFV
jgi:hypothetical protein